MGFCSYFVYLIQTRRKKAKKRINFFFKKYPLISKKFLKKVVHHKVSNYIFYKFHQFNAVQYLWSIWFSFFYVIGFINFLVFMNQQSIFLKILLLGMITVLIVTFFWQENSLLIFLTAGSYFFFFIFIVFFFKVDLTVFSNFYLRLLVLLVIVRPLWHFLIELLFFLLIKQIYPHSWFQKLLPYLSPNFDPLEIKNPNENDDSKKST